MSKLVIVVLLATLISAPVAAPAAVVGDDFESYALGSEINGQGQWTSGDLIAATKDGWIVTDDGTTPRKYIRFWPSPWPGSFTHDQNWAIFHHSSAEPVTSLYLQVEYFVQFKGDLKVWLSGDGIAWSEVTPVLGLVKCHQPPTRWAEADLSAHLGGAGVTNDVYVKFTAATSSSTYWVACVKHVMLHVNEIPSELSGRLAALREATVAYVQSTNWLHATESAEGYSRIVSDPEEEFIGTLAGILVDAAMLGAAESARKATLSLSHNEAIEHGTAALQESLGISLTMGLAQVSADCMSQLLLEFTGSEDVPTMASTISWGSFNGDHPWDFGGDSPGVVGILALQDRLDEAFAAVHVPDPLPVDYPEADVCRALDDVISALHRARSDISGPGRESRVDWHVPGMLSIDLAPFNPFYVGGTAEKTSSYREAVAAYDRAEVFATWRKYVCWGSGGLKLAVTAISAVPAPAVAATTEAVYWKGLRPLCQVAGVASEGLELVEWAALWHATQEYHDTFVADITIVGTAVPAILQQIGESLEDPAIYGGSKSMGVWSVTVPDIETGATVGSGEAVVRVLNSDTVPGTAKVVMEVLLGDTDTVYQVFTSDVYSVDPATSVDIPTSFSLVPNSFFMCDHYTARMVTLTSAGRFQHLRKFRVISDLGLSPEDVVIVDEGVLESGDTAQRTVTAAGDEAELTVTMSYFGSDVDLHVYDATGRHVGFNYDTTSSELGIPGAWYSGPTANPETIVLSNPNAQDFQVELVAVDVPNPEPWVLVARSESTRPAILGLGTPGAALHADAGRSDTSQLVLCEAGGHTAVTGLQVAACDLATLLTGRTLEGSCVSAVPAATEIAAGATVTLSVTASVPSDAEPGNYYGEMLFTHDSGSETLPLTVVVGPGYSIFEDVPPDHWAADAINACYWASTVSGYSSEPPVYRPDVVVKRDQMAVYTSRAMTGGDATVPEEPDGTPSFSDVSTDHWAYRYIEYCYDHRVVQGYLDGYHPDEDVDRGQMAVYVARACGWVQIGDDMTTAPALFPDVPAGFWAGTAVEACVDNDVVYGYEEGYYRPEVTVTRDQMAVYVARAFELLF